jgi:hypothetical protein
MPRTLRSPRFVLSGSYTWLSVRGSFRLVAGVRTETRCLCAACALSILHRSAAHSSYMRSSSVLCTQSSVSLVRIGGVGCPSVSAMSLRCLLSCVPSAHFLSLSTCQQAHLRVELSPLGARNATLVRDLPHRLRSTPRVWRLTRACPRSGK